ncbi:MAG: cysteine desulfurase family protein [Chthoniobacteraceae bacterium]
MLYFDHNATYPLSPAARHAWLEAIDRYPGNASSPHRLGDRADRALTQAREKLAAVLNCQPHEIVWTSGATESNNTAVAHLAEGGAGEAWISAVEHPCLFAAVRRSFAGRHRSIPDSRDGIVDVAWLKNELEHSRPAFVAVMAANNETGVVQPWPEIAEACAEHSVPFLCDAAQWIGRLPGAGLGRCDFVSGCGHKFGGPAGVGFLKAPARLRPLIVGGPQEDGRRAGTENVAGVVASVAALEECEAEMASRLEDRLALRRRFETAFLDAIPEGRIVGANADRLWNTVSVIMPEIDCRQRWVVKLDKLGFAVSTGSACASGKEEPSHVLAAMDYTANEAGRALRFSAGWETTLADWTCLLDGLKRAATELRAPG